MWKVAAVVKLKEGVLDVQGRAVETTLKQLGFQEIKELKVGKYIEFLSSREPSPERLKEIGENFFANPLIETVEFSMVSLSKPGAETQKF